MPHVALCPERPQSLSTGCIERVAIDTCHDSKIGPDQHVTQLRDVLSRTGDLNVNMTWCASPFVTLTFLFEVTRRPVLVDDMRLEPLSITLFSSNHS